MTEPIDMQDALLWAVQKLQKRLNRSRCRLGYGLGWAQGSIIGWGPDTTCKGEIITGKDMPGHARRHSAVPNGWTEPIDLFLGLWTRVSLKEAQVQSYSPGGGANVPSWVGTFAPPGVGLYDFTARLRRRCGPWVTYDFVPCIALVIAKDCYILLMLFFLSFSRPQNDNRFFDITETACPTPRVMFWKWNWLIMSYGAIHYVPLKFERRKNNFRPLWVPSLTRTRIRAIYEKSHSVERHRTIAFEF